MFKKILIANRGEIAVRVMRTCREMGIDTVAVYSDVDAESVHVLEADEAVCLGDANPAESYLNMEKIIKAAKDSGAGAIHPGYGFLAENSEFAALCEIENIKFIGPGSDVIKKLGDKVEARWIMEEGGVPVIPGFILEEKNYEEIEKSAEDIGYPVIIKAVAGGGGKGMRIVESGNELKEAMKSASSEAAAAFNNGDIFLEKYIKSPRHIEFQILADEHGNIIHLLERECSIQRRFQKIIEETPSTAITDSKRDEMGKTSVAAARASGYTNAGTVEFVLDREGNFYFLEVNTRIQVEHPITEMITGIDIVRKQIEIAAGEKLVLKQRDVAGRGHAMECRIYAEDPEKGFAPSPGKINFLKEKSGPGVRIDSGIYSGYTVPMDYDPIMSKVITFAETREININRMINTLENYIILGPETPIPFMIDILKSDIFKKGETYTDLIEEHFSDWKPDLINSHLACIAYVVDEIFPDKKSVSSVEKNESPSPWQTLGNWRL